MLAAGLVIWKLFFDSYPIVNATPEGSAIIAFGDSLTAGTGSTNGNDYPAVLGRRLGIEVLNRGVPGETSTDALLRLDRDVLQEDPRIVIVCLGGNDGLQRVPIDTTLRNLSTIIRSIQGRGALVILAGVRSATFTDQYHKPFRQLARETGCVFVPNILDDILGRPSRTSDQIHPNDAGYAIIAERIANAVEPYLD